MKKYKILSLFFIITIFGAGCAKPKVTSFEMIDYGVMSYDINEIKDNSSVAGGTINILKNERIKQRTNQIPAKIGTLFGFIFKVNGEPKGHEIKIKKVSLTPELSDPIQNKVFTRNEFETNKKIGSIYSRSYMFNYEWELVPGGVGITNLV